MDVCITPHPLNGAIDAVASKSMAHRLLILAALANGPCMLWCNTTSQDIEATASCLRALGATVDVRDGGFFINPIPRREDSSFACAFEPLLDCGESGSTLRFLLPVVAALAGSARLTGHGRLAERPLSPLYEQMVAHGAVLSEQGIFPLSVAGALTSGVFWMPGDISSQFISGLLMAGCVMDEPIEIYVKEPIQSAPYIELTISALALFDVKVESNRVKNDGVWFTSFRTPEKTKDRKPRSPGELTVEGDWSNSAFWLAAGTLTEAGIVVRGVNETSRQGDRAILEILERFGARIERKLGGLCASAPKAGLHACEIDVEDTPDLVLPIAIVAARAQGTTRLKGAARLRIKESDRLETVKNAINALGGRVEVDGDDMIINGVPMFFGGRLDAANDHRIAMMGAIAATFADGPSHISGAHCVAKSYPDFFEDFARLGGLISKED